MESVQAIRSEVVIPWGTQIKRKTPWYPQEVCNDWTHQLSALSLGESPVVKFGVSYPLRTGLGTPTESDFPEYTTYFPASGSYGRKEKGVLEEAFVSRGTCLLTQGPIGGPSFVKGFYRPELSYSTGIGIKSVVKAKFPTEEDSLKNSSGNEEDDSFICLVEKGGISIYSENSSENYVAYMPEFQIDKVILCKYGLLVVPSGKGTTADSDEHRFLYILTHPIKQVSKINQKCSPGAGPGFAEYDTRFEKILWCEDDICVFWSLKNDKITLRRLYKMEKRDIVQSSTLLNASMYYTTQEQSHSPFTPAGGSSMYSPFVRSGHKASAMRVNREGGTVYYWPSFDFSETAHGFNAGFCPPHIGIYDDPELYFKLMFHIDLDPRGKWKEPKKFQLVRCDSEGSRIAIWYLIKTNLYAYCIDIQSGSKISHYSLRGIQDFVCSTDYGAQKLIIVLNTEGHIKIGWLDSNYCITTSAKLDHDIDIPIRNLEYFYNSDTVVCSLKDDYESKALITIKTYLKNNLIAKCIDKFSEILPSTFVAKLIYNLTRTEDQPYFEHQWNDFADVLKESLTAAPGDCTDITAKIFHAVESLKEDMKLNTSSSGLLGHLQVLSEKVLTLHKEAIPMDDLQLETMSLLQTFAKLLLQEDPKSSPHFESLPLVMKILLEGPDSVPKLESLVKLKMESSSFIPVIDILLADVFQRNQSQVEFTWPESAIRVTGRNDYLSGSNDPCSLVKDKVFEVFTPFREKEDSTHEPSWITHVLNMRVFSEDRRLEEVCRLLDSASPLTIDVEQRHEMSDHEFVEEQEKHLLQLIQITFAAPVGRAGFTLRTEQKNFANLTSGIFLPRLCLSGKCATKGTSIELNENDLPATYTAWPNFHNAVASALSVSFLSNPADAWFAHNKARMSEGSEQAGMILGFGLNGILSSMPPTLRHEYLAQENSFTTMAMLLGLCANLAGTGDIATWKVVSLHIGAMLPACTTELEIPRLATLVAPFALGLLFVGTHNSHVAKVLLGEISKKYSPLSIFGGGNGNSSAANINQAESNASAVDREAHSLCSGFGLGFVNLGKGRDGSSCLGEDGFDGILRRFVVGGPKPTTVVEDDEMYNQYGQSMPSLWEEYRCCHIEEGDNVNVDVTTPSAIIAVALTYLRSGNEAVIKWLSPPSTLHLLDGVRPDILMLRSLASILVYETIDDPRKEWLEYHLMPEALSKSFSLKPDSFDLRVDRESIVQAWASIICGYCLGLGIRYAGTSEHAVISTLWSYTNKFLKLASLDNRRKVLKMPKNITEYFPKNFLESCVCTLLISLSLVHAGTGNVKALRLCRYMQSKIAATQITSSSNTYGMEMCIAMATGFLFLGGGRYSLSNEDRSIAVLLASVFPKWPINANDNRYHLQALRHLYVLAAQPRLMLPRPMPHGSKLKFKIEYLDGRKMDARAPILLPPLNLLKRISLNDKHFLPVTFNLPADLSHLKKIVEGGGVLNLVPRPIGHVNQNFVRKMAWRETHTLHSTFEADPGISTDEYNEIKEINCISRIAESVGLSHIIPSLIALRNGDPRRDEWMWQLRILYIWVTLKEGRTSSLLSLDLLALLLNKVPFEFKIFFPVQEN